MIRAMGRVVARRRREAGGASTLAVVLAGVLATVALLVGAVAGVLTDQRRVESAADLAAQDTYQATSLEPWDGDDVEYALERAEWERQEAALS